MSGGRSENVRNRDRHSRCSGYLGRRGRHLPFFNQSRGAMGVRCLAACLLAAYFLAGCSAFAPKVAMPTVDPSKTTPAEKYPVAAKDLPLPHETNIELIKRQMEALTSVWRKARDELNTDSFVLGEGVFYGATAAAIGGLVKSPHLTIAGTGIAGGASLLSDHYQLKVQATNYGNAADVMECLRAKVNDVAAGFWKLYDDSGTLQVGKEYFGDDQAAKDGYDKLSDLIPTIDDNITKVVSTLAKAQADVKFVSPSVADITKAISASAQAKNTANAQSEKVMQRLDKIAAASDRAAFPNLGLSLVRFNAARAAALSAVVDPGLISAIARALTLPADMDACVAAFKG